MVMDQLRSRFPRAVAAIEPRIALLIKAISFGIVGLINTGVDLAVFFIAALMFGLPVIAANTLSWIVAVSGSYVKNSMFTFAAESGRRLSWRAYATFVASGIAGYIANTATVFIVAKYLAPLFIASESGQLVAGKICAIGASFVVNFSLSHFVVFRRRPAIES